MSAALANRLNFSPHPTLRVYHHVAHRRVHAIVKKDIPSRQISDCCIIVFLIVFLPQPAKMTDILPQMKLAFTDGPIARKVSISNSVHIQSNASHPSRKTNSKDKNSPKKPPQIIADAKKHSPPSFYLHWMKSLEMTAAFKHSPTHTQVTFRFPVQREYLNPGGTLHGAAQSLFFDVCTTWLLGPIARKPDYWCSFGTSRSLNVVYLRPAREGDVLTLACEVSFLMCSSGVALVVTTDFC